MGPETIDGVIGYLSLHNMDGYASAVISLRAKNATLTRALEKAGRLAVHALDLNEPVYNVDGWMIDLHNLADEYLKARADGGGDGG